MVAAVLFSALLAATLSVAPPASATSGSTDPGVWTVNSPYPMVEFGTADPFNLQLDSINGHRTMHATTTLKGGPWNGRGLVCGGFYDAFPWGLLPSYANANTALAYGLHDGRTWDCYVYDPAANKWWRIDTGIPLRRGLHSLDATGDGRAIAFAGQDRKDSQGWPNNETWIFTPGTYDPYGAGGVTGSWRQLAPAGTPAARWGHAHTSLPDGRVMIFGGATRSFWTVYTCLTKQPSCTGLVNDSWVFDIAANSQTDQGRWTLVSPATKPTAVVGGVLAPTADGAVLFGGTYIKQTSWITWQDYRTADTWRYASATGTWAKLQPVASAQARAFSAFSPLGGNRFLQSGGLFGSGCEHCQSARILDLSGAQPTWIQLSLPPWSGRDYTASFSAGPGKVMLAGGQVNNAGDGAKAWLYSTLPTSAGCDLSNMQSRGPGDVYKIECAYAAPPAPDATSSPGAGGNAQNLDAHLIDAWLPETLNGQPPNLAALPVVFFVHGGGLVSGSKNDFDVVAARLARAGAVVFNANYTLRNRCDLVAHPNFVGCNRIDLDPGDGDTFTQDMQGLADVANAFKYMWEIGPGKASGRIGDPARIAVVGHSAGAILTQALVEDPTWLATAFGIDPQTARTDWVIAGNVALDIPANFDPQRDLPHSWMKDALDNVMDRASVDPAVPQTALWQRISPSWLFAQRPQTMPRLRIAGAGGRSGSAAEIEEAVPTSREFVTQLQQAGVRASFVQPLIQYSHDGGMCWGQAGHNEGPLLAMSNREFGAPLNARADIPSDTPGVATLGGTSATYYDDSATAACPTTDVTSVSPVGSNRLFDATVLGFMGSARIGAQPATFAWATPQAGDVLPAFTNLSIPDRAATTASPLSLNLGGGATGAWSAARVVTPWASGQNYNPPYASGEATVSGRLFLERSPDLSANGLTALPEDLFNHQLQATSASGSVTVTATVPNGRYRPALYFADRQARTVNATVEGVSFDAVATGGAANAPATRVELGGTIDVTDGTLNVTLAPGSGAVRVAALEVVPAP